MTKKRRRRRKKAVFNPEEFLPKQVISMSDLNVEEKFDEKKEIKPGKSEDSIKSAEGKNAKLQEELARFQIEEDLFKLDEDLIGEVTFDAGLVSEGIQLQKTEEKLGEKKGGVSKNDDESLKLDDLLDMGTSVDQVPTFARIAVEGAFKGSEPAKTTEEEEEEIEEEPEDELEFEMEISTDSLEIPGQDLEDMFREEMIREDVFSRLAEMEIEKKEEEEEIEAVAEEEVAESKEIQEEAPVAEEVREEMPEPVAIEEETTVEVVEEKVETEEEAEKMTEEEAVPVGAEAVKPGEEVVSEVEEKIEEPVETKVESTGREDEMKDIEEELEEMRREQSKEDVSFKEEIVSDTVVVYRKKRKAEDFLKEIEEASKLSQKTEEEIIEEKTEAVEEKPEVIEARVEEVTEEPPEVAPEEEPMISSEDESAREIPSEKLFEEREEIEPVSDEIPEIMEEETVEEEKPFVAEVSEEMKEEKAEIPVEVEKEAELPVAEEQVEEVSEPVPSKPIEASELYSRIDKKFTTELMRIRSEINDILSRMEILEEIKEKMKTSMPELKEYMDRVAPVSAEIPEIKIAGEEAMEIPEIPEIEVPEVAEPALSAKEKKAIKKEVDDLLKGFGKVPIEKEIGYLGTLVRTVPILSFLKPRLSEIILRGDVENKTLVGLHRIASRFLKEELVNKQRELRQVRGEFERFKKGAGRLEKVLGKRGPLGIAGKEEEVPEVEESELFLAREESKKKDKIIAGLEKQLDRMRTDFSNMRARQRKDIDHRMGKFKEEIIIDILSSVDNFQRALDFSRSVSYNEAVVKGFEMTYDDLMSILRKYDLEEIPAKGQRFDPYYHEAILFEETFEQPDGMILEEIRKGYMVNGKLARPSQVKVARNPQAVTADGEVEPQKEEVKEEVVKEEGKKEIKKPVPEAEVKIEEEKKEEELPSGEKKEEESYTIQAFFGSHLDALDE